MEEKKLNDTDIDVGMPDEEIIKALGFKALHDAKVAYLDGCACKHIRVKDILDLIHRLQNENAELQKQVDELKEENGKLVTIGNGFALERNNLREELDELKKRGNVVLLTSLYKKQADDHKRGLSVQRAYWEKQVQKSVKDTAREICLKIIKDQPQPIKEKWVEWFKKEYGVEVE